MARTVVMGDPTHFSVLGGANPHTRDLLGRKKRVDVDLAKRQWHGLARSLISHGVEVCVIEPHERLTGLVYPANAGFLYPLEAAAKAVKPDGPPPVFHLSNLLPTRAGERDIYRRFILSLGYNTSEIAARFEGEADFFPAGRFMIFTYGRIERQRFVARWGLPPWRRVYGFRSEIGALSELEAIAAGRTILPLELCLEAHYHGDTVLCSFGPDRRYLLAFMEGLTPASQALLRENFGEDLVELSSEDGARYAANSFQTDYEGRLFLFVPSGLSRRLLDRIAEREVEPVEVEVSEFMKKGGGSVKCMILDLGPSAAQPATGRSFRADRSYSCLFARERSRD